MRVAVFITRGRKYHADEMCPLMVCGEGLWDNAGEDWNHFAGSYRRTDTVAGAAMRGKLPCLHCVPAELRAFPPLFRQNFGHEPVEWIHGEVCMRCTHNVSYADPETDDWSSFSEPVPWPCTSAVVLGLVPRDQTT